MKNYFLTAALACSFFSCSEDADVVTNELNESVDQIKIKESMKKLLCLLMTLLSIPAFAQQMEHGVLVGAGVGFPMQDNEKIAFGTVA